MVRTPSAGPSLRSQWLGKKLRDLRYWCGFSAEDAADFIQPMSAPMRANTSISEPYPEVGYAETLGGALYVESPGAERFRDAYDSLYRDALGARKSAELMSAILNDLELRLR